jgi:hypothetical protein
MSGNPSSILQGSLPYTPLLLLLLLHDLQPPFYLLLQSCCKQN